MRHIWDVQLQSEQGETKRIEFKARWSPDKDFITLGSVGVAAAVMTSVQQGVKFVPTHCAYKGKQK